MKYFVIFIVLTTITVGWSYCQENTFERLNFILGDWKGTGEGFGNEKSIIESGFNLVMDGKYIEVINESRFDPTDKNPEGEHHIDKGFISYDKKRNMIMYRQFNIEGYVNQYALNDSLSNETVLVFETQIIENFIPGGRARWTVRKINETQIETIFDVSFPDKEYSCYGKNKLIKKQKGVPRDIMKIYISSVLVDDQEKALKFYTEILGFVKKTDMPAGNFRWLTVVSPECPDDIELLLEPNVNPAAKTYQKAIFEQEIPLTSFSVENIENECKRLKKLGVSFQMEPTKMGPVTVAVFDDTCGNLIQLVQK